MASRVVCLRVSDLLANGRGKGVLPLVKVRLTLAPGVGRAADELAVGHTPLLRCTQLNTGPARVAHATDSTDESVRLVHGIRAVGQALVVDPATQPQPLVVDVVTNAHALVVELVPHA